MDAGTELRESFVEAYPVYVARVLHQRGIEMVEIIADAVVEGVAVLDGLLARFGGDAPVEQTHSPLELFAEALRPVDRALGTVGVAPAPGSPANLHPWDVYGLAPGSSAVLGERARAAHLAWGVAKASALGVFTETGRSTRPGILVLCDGSDREQIETGIDSAGYSWADAPDPGVVVALVDDAVASSDAAIAEALDRGTRVIVYGELDDLRTIALSAQGVWKCATREQVLHHLSELLPSIA